jgi:TolB-like protein/DNA-binding winged helix-turn-helix (wHTH) protein/Flp pilus assembly protein TadD
MLAFGSFELDTDRRQLRRDGVPIALSSRAFDILVLLIDRRDRVVTKDEIMAGVWRGMIVEENNLAVQISALRRALADGADNASVIVTVPGQGYRFIGRLGGAEREAPRHAAPPPAADPLPPDLEIPSLPILEAHPAPASRPMLRRRLPVQGAACGLVILGLAGLAMLRPGHKPPPHIVAQAPPRLSIAVLPFRDLSDDRCCDYLADAISDDLTTDLSLIPGSVVIARESSDVYRGHPAPAGEIGRALGVRYLLEGSLRAVEGSFSINAQLIEAAGGTHLWAERFTVPRAHLADAQAAIVQRLSSALGVKLVDIEGARSAHEHPDNPDALDLFLRARSILDRADTLEAMNQAQALLEQAVAKQPDNVAALSELGWLLPRKATNLVDPNRAGDIAAARRWADRALALAPREPASLVAHAAIQVYDGDCAGAALSYQLALDGEPDSVRALTGLSVCASHRGRFAEAADILTRLLRIDPEGPRQKNRYYQLGFARLMMGDAAGAIPWLEKSIAGDLDPRPGTKDLGLDGWRRLALIAALRLSGDIPASDTVFAGFTHAWPDRSTWALEANSPRTYGAVPAYRGFIGALEQAGMPRFADENAGAAAGPCDMAGAVPTPHSVPGIKTIDAAALAALMRSAKPLTVDFGVGAAVPQGAQLSTLDTASATDMATLAKAAAGAVIVTMGTGIRDADGCRAALRLADAGASVLWFRGGEEAWAHAGLPASDRR